MKTTTTILLFLGFVSLGCAQVHVDGGSSGSCGGAGGETITTSSGSTSSTSSAASVCPDPQLGFDESDAPIGPIGPLAPIDADIASLVVMPLAPFDAPTTCETVVLGLATGGPCEKPEAIEVVSFDHDPSTVQDPPAIVSTISLDDLPGASLGEGALALHLPVDTYHAPGIPPLVGVRVRSNVCPLVMPSCSDAAPLRYRAQEPEGWSAIDDVPALFVGLTDCVSK